MKIALIGTAPSSIRLAPYSDPSWQIWACSPGAYPVVGRSERWFELHRWEPPVIGNPAQQKPWFTPEYVAWLGKHPWVYLQGIVPEVPNGRLMPVNELRAKYGDYFFTSTIAWMLAIAIEEILADRQKRDVVQEGDDSIGLWGIDMAASEEYGYQRAGCQFFLQIAHQLGIRIAVPPESDIMRPAPLYGIGEGGHMAIKLLERKRELTGRLNDAMAQQNNVNMIVTHLRGAIDDLDYMINTWTGEDQAYGADFREIFKPLPPKPAPDYGPQ